MIEQGNNPATQHINVCLIKNRSKLSSVLLLCLLQIFMRQTLYWRLSDLYIYLPTMLEVQELELILKKIIQILFQLLKN